MRYLLFLLPLLFIAGCTQTNNSGSTALSNFKCTLPSRPGTVEANITGFPQQIVVSSSQDTPITFSVMFTNTMTNPNPGSGPTNVDVTWNYYPNVGPTDSGNVEIPYASYYQTDNKIVPMIGTDTVSSTIPKQMSVVGAYTGTFSWSFDAKTVADIPICLGYDPKITGISPEELVCNPDEAPQPCYSASPIEVKIEKVTCIGGVPAAGSSNKVTGQCMLTLQVVDAYGGLGECYQHKIIQNENVTIDNISLVVDNAEFNMGSDVFKCTGYSIKNGKKVLYLSQTNTIQCIIYLSKLSSECGNGKGTGSNCYINNNVLTVGKTALIKVELSYHYCMARKLGPAQLVRIS